MNTRLSSFLHTYVQSIYLKSTDFFKLMFCIANSLMGIRHEILSGTEQMELVNN